VKPVPTQLGELLKRLVAGRVRFVLVGGMAVNAWGYRRGTEDVDLVPDPDPENLQRLRMTLEDLGGRVMVGDRPLARNAIDIFLRAGDKTYVVTRLGVADVLQGIPQIPRYEELVASAEDAELEGVSVKVCSFDHLMAMKEAAGREVDLLDIKALRVARGLEEDGDTNA